MLCGLLLEELAIFAFGYDFRRIILSCGPIEPMSKCFAYDREP
jgi:hypothetical protein